MAKNKSYYAYIDEVGRGSISGPVLCGVVLIRADKELKSIYKDSKSVSLAIRNKMYDDLLLEDVELAYGSASNREIDKFGLSIALSLASNRALNKLTITPEKVFLDGSYDYVNLTRKNKIDVLCIIKGDSLINEISAASIFAKVKRDKKLCSIAKLYPYYNWDRNAGYGTKDHFEAIMKHGLSKYHRESFIKKKYF